VVIFKIDGANTGSGVIIEQQGNRYVVLSNWPVVSGDNRSTKSFTIQSVDRREHLETAGKTVNALPGMSGGAILDNRGNLVDIDGRATVDLRTGTVNSVLGIDINRYLRDRGDLPKKKWRKYN
jgi:hypothetical protein